MRICQIDADNAVDIRRFIQFPFDLYKNDPNWVPPFIQDMHRVFNRRRHPFYRTSTAGFFMVESAGCVLGRIALLRNRQFCEYYKTNTGFFYYLEFIDDNQVFEQLMDTALQWGRANELTSYLGPRGFLRSDGFGLLIDGFDTIQAMGVPYNPPYYAGYLDNYGFEKVSDLYSGYLVPSYEMPAKVIEAAERVRKRTGFKVLKFNRKADLLPWIEQIRIVYEEAFKENPNYYPSTKDEYNLISRTLYQIADPRLVKIIVKDDEIAGFVLVYPNITRTLQKIQGRLYPFGWVQVLRALKTSKIVDLNGIGFLPKYQGLGANILVYAELEKTLRAYGAQYGNFVQVDERNYRSKSDMDNMGVIWNKIHRLYHLNFAPA